jgi:hypothetical protein
VKRRSWFLVFIFFAVSCLEDPDCYQLNNEVIGISFRVAGSSAPDSVTLRSVAHNAVENVFLMPTVATDTTITAMFALADRTVNGFDILFDYMGVNKTLSLKYLVKAQFVSEDCGTRYVISDMEATYAGFDSVLVTNTSPGRDSRASNITIYRCPQANTLEAKLWQYTIPATGASTARLASVPFMSVDYGGTLLYQGERVATLRLPVRTDATEGDYHLAIADDLGNDVKTGTLGITYRTTTNKPWLACGPLTTIDNIRIKTAFEVTEFQDNTNGTDRDRLTDPIVTNLNIYRCPPTNFIQLAFVGEGTTTARDAELVSITDDFSGRTFHEGVTARRVLLALNKDATSTTFNLNFEDRTEVVTFNYSFTTPRAGLYPVNSPCISRGVITDLSVVPNDDVQVPNSSVLVPAVDNAYVEIPN